MKKIVISTLPLKAHIEKRVYPVDGNALIQVDEPIMFAVTPAVGLNLKKDDEVKVILLETKGGENGGDAHITNFIDELNHFNKAGAKIAKAIVPIPFEETKSNFQNLFRTIIRELEQGAEIYADVTYGPKPVTLLIFTFLQFAEKFFDCSIGNIVYSKVEFSKGQIVDGSEKIYDITPVYLINSFLDVMEASSGEGAIKAIDALLKD